MGVKIADAATDRVRHMRRKTTDGHSFTVKTILILSCITVVLAPLLTALSIYHFAADSIERQTRETNSAYLELAVSTLDEFLDGVDSQASTLMLDRTFTAICLYESELSTTQRYTLTNFVWHELWDTAADQGTLAKAVYLRNSGIFLLPNTYQTAARARSEAFSSVLWTDEQYALLQSSLEEMRYFPVKTNQGYGLAFVRPVFKQASQHGANLVYILSMQRIVDSLRAANWNSEGILAMVDADNNVLLSTQEGLELEKEELLTLENGGEEIRLNGENTLCLVKKSQRYTLRCLYIAPFRVMYSRLFGMRTTCLISAALCLAATVLLIVLVVRRNYRPIHRIMKTIPASGEEEGNEMDIIYSTLEQHRAARLGLEQELMQNRQELARSFLARLLTGSVRPSAYAYHRLALYDRPLEAERYAVAALCAPEFFGGSGASNVAHNVMTLFCQTLKKRLPGITVYETADRAAELALIGFEAGQQQALVECVRAAAGEIGDALRLQLTVGMSTAGSDIEKLTLLYRQATVALEFAQMQQENSFAQYPEQESDIYQFPLELENQMIQTVREGDGENAKRLLLEYLDGAAGRVSVASRQCMRFDLVAMCLRVYANADRILTRDVWGGTHAAQELMESDNLETLRELILQQITRLCQALQDKQRSGKGNLASRIQEYVQGQWRCSDLSVAQIAEHFNMHPSYISRLFKEEQGIGLLTYINKFRVEQAEEMLLSTSQTVGEIAQACGFVNDSALIRIFKQYVGTTPGKFRAGSAR